MKITLKILLFLALLALPFALRWAQLHPGAYQPPVISTLDSAKVAVESAPYAAFTDRPQPGDGIVLIDQAHENNLQVDDLTPLKERLAARSASLRVYDYSSDSLAFELRRATAFVVADPTLPFTPDEVRAVRRFVENGGLLLLVADPTRSAILTQEYGYFGIFSLFYPQSAVPAVNSVANAFGLSYFDDYLYNLADYETNYRNIRFHELASSPLTKNVETVTVFAAHSVQGRGQALFVGDANTASNVRTHEAGLTTAMLTENGRVLALGDLSFLTSPHHQAAGNNQFLSNLADWLSTSQRTWALKDFPYLFTHEVEWVPLFPEGLPAEVISLAARLQEQFADVGLSLRAAAEPSGAGDAILVGLYSDPGAAAPLLAQAGIELAIVEPQAGEESTEESPGDLEKSTLTLKGLGDLEADTSLLYLLSSDESGARLVILAPDTDGLTLAVDRLQAADFAGCLAQAAWVVCPTDAPVGQDDTPEVGDNGAGGRIFILSLDDGAAGRSSAPEWIAALGDMVDVTLWSTAERGMPSAEDVIGYDAYILDTSDFPYDEDWSNVPSEIYEANWFIIGQQTSDPAFGEFSPLDDLEVGDASHPLLDGMTLDSVIALSASSSGVPAYVILDSEDSDETTVVFRRGPASSNPGTPALLAYDFEDSHFGLGVFAFYRLPEDLQQPFALNLAAWLLNR
jgi:hypothetical protein